jgi:hypothetical protein
VDFSRGVARIREPPRPRIGFPEQQGGAVLFGQKISIAPAQAIKVLFRILAFLLLCVVPGISQKPQPGMPKYDLQTETKTKGIVDEINVLALGTRKDFTELVIKSGEDKLHIYVCPKPFQDEMGISFTKGDELVITGSKVKQEASDVILARQLVKGTDTLMFRDDKGNPVWDPRTGK